LGIVNACASAAAAIGLAADMIRLNRIDVALAGGTEAPVTLLSLGSFANGGGVILTDNPERASRPFSHDRAGFVVAEGCGLVVLESLERARARGAKVHALLAGHASTNDAYHIISPEPDGASWARTMKLALDDARLSADAVDIVSAHAPSTKQGDLAETLAIKRLFGARAAGLPVSGTKSMHGHAWGAAGAIETVLALAAMKVNMVLPTINHLPDSECDLDCVPNQARPLDAQTLLKNSFGFGGTNTSLVFQRVN
jgi:3-oxoacyl-(acyl-carrier-protein) synthase